MFLNLLNTDPTVMTLLNYGVEGYTYEQNLDGTIYFTNERANYLPWRNGLGNVRILPPTMGEDSSYWEHFSTFYNSAEVLPCKGFIFDSSELYTECVKLESVSYTYAYMLLSGSANPKTELPKFLNALKDAGIEKFVEEANKQLKAYLRQT